MSHQRTLIEICEPLFLTLCEERRLARSGLAPNYDQTRNNLRDRLRECGKEAVENDLRMAWKQAEPALRCFLDDMLESLGGEWPREWEKRRLAEEDPFDIRAGREAFFATYLEPALEAAQTRRTDEGIQVLEVLYACLLFGFVGSYQTNPTGLAELKARILVHVQGRFGQPARQKLTPQAYEHTLDDKLDIETKPAMWGLGALTALFVLVFFLFGGWRYANATKELNADVNKILQSERLKRGNP
jgi:type IV/VI secretion system ImpK/VasF family protein